MNFISLKFILFLTLLIILQRMVKRRDTKHNLLLVASYAFYAFSDIRFLVLLIGLSITVWYLGILIQRKYDKGDSAKLPMTLGVAACLLTLGFFKYFNFFSESVIPMFGITNQRILNVVLPLGISFYTLQAISYILDIYYRRIKAVKSIRDVLLYIGFFPQIVSGPIVKARDFFPQLEKDYEINWDRLSYGMQLILRGVFKKAVIADRLSIGVNEVYASPMAYSGVSLLVTTIAYAIQIYADFSGYSDMAIGIAYILGFDLGENFEMPYIAENPSEFWKRWHISLSSWFRDYVYIPLGGNRKGSVRTYLNLFLTMLISGLWHGATWNFVVWGAIHGFALIVHKIYCDFRKQKVSNINRTLLSIVSILSNTVLVWGLWILFRSDSMLTAWTIIKRILTMADGIYYINVFAVVFAILIVGYQIVAKFFNNGKSFWKPLDLNRFISQVIIFIFVLIIFIFSYIGDTAFIYSQF